MKKIERNARGIQVGSIQADAFGAYVCGAEWDPDIDNMALVEVH
jgi:hypothetical protein